MAKDKKEKREEKMMKKAMLKVKPEKKFKKKKVVNEVGGINHAKEEREHDQVVVKGLKSRNSESNALAKIKKKKLKEKKLSKRTSSLEANCEERVSAKKEGKKVSPGEGLGNQEESNSVSKKKLKGKRMSQLKGSFEVNNEARPSAKKEEKTVSNGENLGNQEGSSSVSKKKSKKSKKKGSQVYNEQDIQSKPGQGLDEKKSQESFEIVMKNAEEISSVDEDSSRGMKKWLREYKESRPGIVALQQQIDDFVSAHEEKLEQERKEREAAAAEGGWTVVVHHKGRKKTTDAESGTTVGSVAPAAVLDKMSKKKSKEVALNFYRFQKREAQRSEIMMLQEKFEQDRKRIQQLKAARKFRPY